MWKIVMLTGSENTVEAEVTVQVCSTMASRTQTDNKLQQIADSIMDALGKTTQVVVVR
jgi:hypothetical protein